MLFQLVFDDDAILLCILLGISHRDGRQVFQAHVDTKTPEQIHQLGEDAAIRIPLEKPPVRKIVENAGLDSFFKSFGHGKGSRRKGQPRRPWSSSAFREYDDPRFGAKHFHECLARRAARSVVLTHHENVPLFVQPFSKERNASQLYLDYENCREGGKKDRNIQKAHVVGNNQVPHGLRELVLFVNSNTHDPRKARPPKPERAGSSFVFSKELRNSY